MQTQLPAASFYDAMFIV